eukprot:191181-Prymnesium_polylepis.1
MLAIAILLSKQPTDEAAGRVAASLIEQEVVEKQQEMAVKQEADVKRFQEVRVISQPCDCVVA